RVARERFNGWHNREKFTQLTGDNKPETMEEAYAVQSALYEIMRDEAGFTEFAGHKVALTSPAIQEMCGVDEPAYGSVFREFVHPNGHEIRAGDFIRLGIEFEVAFEIGEDVPVSDGRQTKDTVAPFVSAAMPAFELIDDRDADYAHLDAMSILCDRCWCNGIVLGERVEDWQSLDIGNLASGVVWNGMADEQGNTGAALGHPLNSVAFVANHLQANGKQLKAGEIIMTGSALKTRFPKPGDTAVYHVEGLGEVTARVMSEA
ncbi:MAG: fumarylacetoacetate hydrolase family protein, partial [Pseudomonadota bacterium]